MERRKDTRAGAQQNVTVTVLSGGDPVPFAAVAVDISEGGMRIFSPSPVPYQSAVKIEAGDFLLLGEVIRIEASVEGVMLGIKLLHSLNSLGDLRRLNQALQWESCLKEADCDTIRI